MKRLLKLPVDDELMALLEENRGDYSRYSDLIRDALVEHFTSCSTGSGSRDPPPVEERLETVESRIYEILETLRSISSRVDEISIRIGQFRHGDDPDTAVGMADDGAGEFEWVVNDSADRDDDGGNKVPEDIEPGGVIDLEDARVMEMPQKILHLPGDEGEYDEEDIYGDRDEVDEPGEPSPVDPYDYGVDEFHPSENYENYDQTYPRSHNLSGEKDDWPYEVPASGAEANTPSTGGYPTVDNTSPACPYCGGKLTLIEEYGKHYCYHCEEYITEKDIRASVERFTVEKKKEKGFLYRLLYGE